MLVELMAEVAPAYTAAFALAGAAVLILAVILTSLLARRRKARPAGAHGSGGAHSAPAPAAKRMGFGFGTQFWPLVFAALLVIFAVCLYKGMVGLGAVRTGQLCAAVTVLGLLTYLRVPIHNGLDALYLHGAAGRHASRLLVLVRDVAILLVCAALLFILTEYPWNITIATTMSHKSMLLECAIIFAALVTLYLLGQRRGHLCVLVAVFLTLVGLGQYFVVQFKSAAILPSDLLALGTAAAVSDRFTYVLGHRAIIALCCGVLALFLLSLLVPNTAKRRRGRVALRLVLGVVCLVGCIGGMMRVSLEQDLGLVMNNWNPLETYSHYGFLPSFLCGIQSIPIDVPDGYTHDGAAQLERSYVNEYNRGRGGTIARAAAVAQYAKVKPSIVVIMNEAYTDLAPYEGLHGGYTGPPFINTQPADALVRGHLNVSTVGGGTCNTEFEFLTGNSIAYIGLGKTPYSFYRLDKVAALPRQLLEEGYDTIAIHPNLASNWGRDKVYPDLGFQEFLDIDDFEGVETYHGAVSDWATYETVLDRLAADDKPLFVFDVTMQNHSGYTQGNIPEEDQVHVAGEDLTEELVAQCDEYAACINESDRALAAFIEQLKEIDEPVIVVFFGDHQPSFAIDLNDIMFADQETPQFLSNESWTPYLVWANYDVASNPQAGVADDVSANYLGALLLDAIGAPLTDYQKAQLAVRAKMPSVCAYGYQTIDRVWHCEAFEDATVQSPYEDLRTLQYLNFAENV